MPLVVCFFLPSRLGLSYPNSEHVAIQAFGILRGSGPSVRRRRGAGATKGTKAKSKSRSLAALGMTSWWGRGVAARPSFVRVSD
jgi:hypothetical protein